MNWWDDLECLSVSEICKSLAHGFWKREDSGGTEWISPNMAQWSDQHHDLQHMPQIAL